MCQDTKLNPTGFPVEQKHYGHTRSQITKHLDTLCCWGFSSYFLSGYTQSHTHMHVHTHVHTHTTHTHTHITTFSSTHLLWCLGTFQPLIWLSLLIWQLYAQWQAWNPHAEKQELGVAAIFGDDADAGRTLNLGTIQVYLVAGLCHLQGVMSNKHSTEMLLMFHGNLINLHRNEVSYN